MGNMWLGGEGDYSREGHERKLLTASQRMCGARLACAPSDGSVAVRHLDRLSEMASYASLSLIMKQR